MSLLIVIAIPGSLLFLTLIFAAKNMANTPQLQAFEDQEQMQALSRSSAAVYST